MRMHEDQLDVDAVTVTALIAEQYPSLTGQRVRPVLSGGTVNAIFRVGDDACARFPLRASDPDSASARLRSETTASERFLRAAAVPSPRPLFIGRPGHGYPTAWSLQTWVPGEQVTPTSHQHSRSFADALARLIRALREADTEGGSFAANRANPASSFGRGRGGDLSDHDHWVQQCLARSTDLVDVASPQSFWNSWRDLPRLDPDVLSHTDLIPGNLLAAGRELTGVLDTGGTQPADPALDLVCAWHLFEAPAREHLRTRLGCSELQWERGRAWAFEQAIGSLWYYQQSNPAMAEMSRVTLSRLLTD